jgi:hypothetical protein
MAQTKILSEADKLFVTITPQSRFSIMLGPSHSCKSYSNFFLHYQKLHDSLINDEEYPRVGLYGVGLKV